MYDKKGTVLRNPKIYNPSDFKETARQEKTKWPKYLIIFVIFLAVFGFLYYLVLQSDYFKIKNIIVENNANPVLAEKLEKFKGQNIILFKTDNIKNELIDEFPEIYNVEIIRGLPDTIKIKFLDYKPRIIWQANGSNYLVSSDGKVYQETTGQSDLPLVKDNKDLSVQLGQTVASENFINFIINLNNAMQGVNSLKINHFEINDTIFQAYAVTDQGLKILFDSTRNPESQVEDLQKYLEANKDQAKEYIDLRVEGKVYYK